MGSNSSIMIIEDDDNVRQLMVDILHEEGYDVVECPTGEDALRSLETTRPAAITLDLAMPAMDGVEFLRAIKARPETSAIPVVVVSAAPGALREQIRPYVTEALGKPFHMADLLEAIGRALGRDAATS